MKNFWNRNTAFILILTGVCSLLGVVVSSIETVVACDKAANCEDVEFEKVVFETDASLKKQREILAVLFDLPEKIVFDETFYDYNYYGDNCDFSPPWKEGCAYNGGHAGWDVQTRDKSREQPFYSLTNGVVLLDGSNGEADILVETKFNAIAIYDDKDTRRTTFYLHASAVHPSIKKGRR